MTAQTASDPRAGGEAPRPADDGFLTVSDVAERVRVHPQTVGAWIARGELHAIRIGRTVKIRQSGFEEMLEGARIAPAMRAGGAGHWRSNFQPNARSNEIREEERSPADDRRSGMEGGCTSTR